MNNIEYRVGSLSSLDNQKIDFMIESLPLPEQWYLDLCNKTKIIWDIKSIYVTWRAALQNYNSLLNFVADHKPKVNIASEIYLLGEEAQGVTITLAQLITNCIVSFTTFLTVTEKKLSGDSEAALQLELWNVKRKALHKENFSYRLGYELRNYSQHYEIPITEVVFTIEKDSVVLLQAYVKASNLLAGSYNWKGLKRELEIDKNATIDLMKVLREYARCVNDIYVSTLHVHSSRILECRNYLGELCSKHEIDKDSHPVVFKGSIFEGENLPRETEFIPLYLLNQMQSEWARELSFSLADNSVSPIL